MPKKLNTSIFIERSKKIHGDKYDYSKVDYINNRIKVTIICSKHGEFLQAPNIHLRKHGCPKCGFESIGRHRVVTNRPYKYTKHNVFIMFKKVHNYKYEYNEESFMGMSEKIEIHCPIHGAFLQGGFSHLQGHGCPRCNTSRGEIKIYDYLKQNNIKHHPQHRFINCKNTLPLPFDFYLPEYNICIEFDGKQHFDEKSRFYSTRLIENDKIKNRYCKDNGIKLIRIPF